MVAGSLGFDGSRKDGSSEWLGRVVGLGFTACSKVRAARRDLSFSLLFCRINSCSLPPVLTHPAKLKISRSPLRPPLRPPLHPPRAADMDSPTPPPPPHSVGSAAQATPVASAADAHKLAGNKFYKAQDFDRAVAEYSKGEYITHHIIYQQRCLMAADAASSHRCRCRGSQGR